MDLRIQRTRQIPEGKRSCETVIGSLYVNGIWHAFTQEPGLREDGAFIPGETALPVGTYNVSVAYSKRFGRDIPLVVATRAGGERRGMRIGMRIHPGRPQIDEGCEIVLGQIEEPKFVSGTRLAFDTFFSRLLDAIKRGEAADLEIA